MATIYEINYFHELHKGKTSHYVAHFKEVEGYEKLDEGFVERSFRVIGTVIVESGKNTMKYTFHNFAGLEVFSKEYPIVRDQDFYDYPDEKIHSFFYTKEFYENYLPCFLEIHGMIWK